MESLRVYRSEIIKVPSFEYDIMDWMSCYVNKGISTEHPKTDCVMKFTGTDFHPSLPF